ncbi:endoplasmic reticulum junction formation protein lunapark-B isoform X2 [Periplaneta americana]|uniref:endoplasmic reticulum junction formation protein lunapark-B isoform X2 n=1 Tax=Periplaneta americana TaxID=6978 RepID=UPI0037E801CC
MGLLLSRFQRKKTTLEILESLENRIKSIEENRLHTEQRQRKIVGHLILYSVGAYVIAAVLFYFLYFPASLQDQLFYITPLLIFPVIVVFVKRLVTWYYRRKLTRNQEKLHDMREEKKKLLEDVMDKETYKVAKEILEKFAPDQLRKPTSMTIPTRMVPSSSTAIQRRSVSTPAPSSVQQSSPAIVGGSSIVTSTPGTDVRRRSLQQPSGPIRPPVSMDPAMFVTPSGQTNGQGVIPRPPMPRPVLPRERSYLDKLVEYLVGDGPSNRYALICKQCDSHNGMALKEEFEYFAFRCCYCFYWNPARKQRPQAPRLPSATSRSSALLPGHTSASELESASDSEESGSEQQSDSESTTKEGGVKISEVDTNECDLEDSAEPGEQQDNKGEADKSPVESKISSSEKEEMVEAKFDS